MRRRRSGRKKRIGAADDLRALGKDDEKYRYQPLTFIDYGHAPPFSLRRVFSLVLD
jgi:hypothetical protein